MPLKIKFKHISDPDGHNPALLLKGDWLIIQIDDGNYCGYGEASHSCNDNECKETILKLFDAYVKDIDLCVTAIVKLSQGSFCKAYSFVTATAISGLNQALYDLVSKREHLPVWGLFTETKCQTQVPVYATINRALTTRTPDNYYSIVTEAVKQGLTAIKCAPFEKVCNDGDQLSQCKEGLLILEYLRKNFPDLNIRIDFHERFHLQTFKKLLPALESISPFWLEAPLPIGQDYSELRSICQMKMALGELYFGRNGFSRILENGWADVIMPDIKHVGGFGPLLDVCQHFSGKLEISPHNPSGPVATAASLHAAAICPAVTSLEVPLIADNRRAYYLEWLNGGMLRIPDGFGWGLEL